MHKRTPPRSALKADSTGIESAFAGYDANIIRLGLEEAARAGADFAKLAWEALATKSPTSQAIALRQMRFGENATFEQAMAIEYRIVSRICRGHDFYEGVRAVIVDKDNRPLWRPAPGEAVDPTEIDKYFATLGADDLVLESGAA